MVNILGANSVSGGYEIDNSVRYNDGDSPYLSKTFSSSNAYGRVFTLSFWIKRSAIGLDQYIFHARSADSQGNFARINFNADDTFQFRSYNKTYIKTNRVFRDPAAWYHIVLAVDTNDSTAGNRVKFYVNGVLESDLETDTNPDESEFLIFGSDRPHFIGVANISGNKTEHFDGYYSEFNFIDGTQKDVTDFGEFDDNGVWIPKKYTGAYSTNGFYLEFKETGTGTDASGIGADTSGNTHHFAPTNLAATDVTTDTPTNNFATFNPAGGANSSGQWTFSEGNTQIQQNDNGNWRATGSTMAVANGKWYWEIEFDAGTMEHIFVGVHDSEVSLEGTNRWVAGSTLFYNHEGGEIRQDGTNTTADYGVLTAGDILGVALNMDDKQISFYDNGSAIVSNFALSSSIIGFAMPTFMSDASNIVYKVNFGNPAFAISSGNADANGYGNFEYAVPSGYYSLCTKNLAEFG